MPLDRNLSASSAWSGSAIPSSSGSFRERRTRARARTLALTIIFHPDVRRIGARVLLSRLSRGPVALGRDEPFFAAPGDGGELPLATRFLPAAPLRLSSRADGTIAIEAPPGFEAQANGRPVGEGLVLSAAELDQGAVLLLARRVVLLVHWLPARPTFVPDRHGLVGESEAISRVREEIDRVADLDVPVLLRSETGTGKELVARAIHRASQRHREVFLSLNMGALPVSLAAAELFGSVKGAYTGSVRSQAGYFARAQGGSLFLDEIGDAPGEVQVMLLRVLETGELQRVGSQEPQRTDVRLIAATDADLEAAIQAGRFREPLLHRLSGYEIVIPPLRERRDDFGRLLFHFLREELQEIGNPQRLPELKEAEQPWLPASVVARLACHPWPGNVRQLRNVARQLAVASRGATTVRITPQVERMLREAEAVQEQWAASHAEVADSATTPGAPRRPLRAYRKPGEVDEDELVEALRNNRWKLKPTAAQLGISRPSLYALIDRSTKIRKARDLTRKQILEAQERCQGDLGSMVEQLEVSEGGLKMRMRELDLI